jgi:GNAT superfamily N-acetyltransferase
MSPRHGSRRTRVDPRDALEQHGGVGFQWTREVPAKWDDDKVALIAGSAPGTFRAAWADTHQTGELVPGDWWRVEDESGELVGFGWMDVTWGDAEILLVTAPAHRGKGVGTFVLDKLAAEAKERGINYLCNVIPDGHPDGDGVRRWLEARGFATSEDGRLARATAR